MCRVDSRSTRLRETFHILDEPGVGTLVLDGDMQVAWANTYAMDILSAREEDILGSDACQILDMHLVPLPAGERRGKATPRHGARWVRDARSRPPGAGLPGRRTADRLLQQADKAGTVRGNVGALHAGRHRTETDGRRAALLEQTTYGLEPDHGEYLRRPSHSTNCLKRRSQRPWNFSASTWD